MGEVIGRGGYGVVCRAYDTVRQTEVAIKCLNHGFDQRLLNRVEQEIKIHSTLNHPNVVQFLGSFNEGGTTYIVLEYCANGSVVQAMDRCENRRLPLADVRKYMHDLAQAVRYLHSHIIIHRDLKPGNMLLDANNNVKLCDFGLATTVSRLKLEGNTICGTINYIPPEVFRQKAVTTSVDLWSYGCVLFSLITGLPPFTSYSREQTAALASNASYSLPADVDADAADLIKKLLVKDQSQRPSISCVFGHPFFVEKAPVEPQRCPFKGGVVEILGNGDMVLDITGYPTLFRIVRGGDEIEVATRSGSQKKVYPLTKLPKKYRERYEFTLKIARQAEEHKPLVIWNADSGKYVLFGNHSMGLVRGKAVMVIPDGQKTEIKTAMLGIAAAVQQSGQATWPVVVGRAR
jgi:serine/threonine protein kinase